MSEFDEDLHRQRRRDRPSGRLRHDGPNAYMRSIVRRPACAPREGYDEADQRLKVNEAIEDITFSIILDLQFQRAISTATIVNRLSTIAVLGRYELGKTNNVNHLEARIVLGYC